MIKYNIRLLEKDNDTKIRLTYKLQKNGEILFRFQRLDFIAQK